MSVSPPPYRADHVGSLLRPASVVQARRKHFEEGSVSAQQLKEVEDAAIPQLIRMQEDAGLRAVTDGMRVRVAEGKPPDLARVSP